MPATQMANEPNGPRSESSRAEPSRAEALNEAELDERARKRIEVGLSPRRPTAKAAPQRPPDVHTLPMPPLALALLLLLILGLTAGLVAMNLTGWRPAWWPAGAFTGEEAGEQTTQVEQAVPMAPGAYALTLSEDFSKPTSALLQGEERQEWRAELLAAESVYRIQVWPGHLAWSLLGLEPSDGYRLQTSVAAAATTPDGYAGLIVRYQDERHFYLFAVDGQGRFLVQRQDGEETIPVQPWTAAEFLNRAGSANVLTVEDMGDALRFFGNGMLLYELSGPAYATGHVGLAGGSLSEEVGELRFDWLQLYQGAEPAPAP